MDILSVLFPLRTEDEMRTMLHSSRDGITMLFKHSATCPVSQSIAERITTFLADNPYPLPSWVVIVQESRTLSDMLAQQLEIRHETPQVILLHGERPVWTASHGKITGDSLRQAMAQLYSSSADTVREEL